MVRKKNLTVVTQPQAYFHQLVTDALCQHRLSTQPETEFYLVNLLNQFMTTDRLYLRDQNGEFKEEPLAVLVKEAIEEPQNEVQRLLFRHIGDVSLYVAGFFQESLNRKRVDLDYYIGMGGAAYGQVAVRADDKPQRGLFQELSAKFPNFVEVLALVSDQTTPRSEKDLLRLYELWERTGSERAAKALHAAGIIPNKNIKKDVQ